VISDEHRAPKLFFRYPKPERALRPCHGYRALNLNNPPVHGELMNNNKASGYIMAGIGFAMLLANAFSYIFDYGISSPAFTILGIVFVVGGLKTARKPKR